MSYKDQFRSPSFYYVSINRLIKLYTERGYVNMVYDWERSLRNVADMPDLKRLARKADYLYTNLQGEVHAQAN